MALIAAAQRRLVGHVAGRGTPRLMVHRAVHMGDPLQKQLPLTAPPVLLLRHHHQGEHILESERHRHRKSRKTDDAGKRARE
eukprot:scaffold330460_cov82-Tisochrysis_lutea.AAC.1